MPSADKTMNTLIVVILAAMMNFVGDVMPSSVVHLLKTSELAKYAVIFALIYFTAKKNLRLTVTVTALFFTINQIGKWLETKKME